MEPSSFIPGFSKADPSIFFQNATPAADTPGSDEKVAQEGKPREAFLSTTEKVARSAASDTTSGGRINEPIDFLAFSNDLEKLKAAIDRLENSPGPDLYALKSYLFFKKGEAARGLEWLAKFEEARQGSQFQHPEKLMILFGRLWTLDDKLPMRIAAKLLQMKLTPESTVNVLKTKGAVLLDMLLSKAGPLTMNLECHSHGVAYKIPEAYRPYLIEAEKCFVRAYKLGKDEDLAVAIDSINFIKNPYCNHLHQRVPPESEDAVVMNFYNWICKFVAMGDLQTAKDHVEELAKLTENMTSLAISKNGRFLYYSFAVETLQMKIEFNKNASDIKQTGLKPILEAEEKIYHKIVENFPERGPWFIAARGKARYLLENYLGAYFDYTNFLCKVPQVSSITLEWVLSGLACQRGEEVWTALGGYWSSSEFMSAKLDPNDSFNYLHIFEKWILWICRSPDSMDANKRGFCRLVKDWPFDKQQLIVQAVEKAQQLSDKFPADVIIRCQDLMLEALEAVLQSSPENTFSTYLANQYFLNDRFDDAERVLKFVKHPYIKLCNSFSRDSLIGGMAYNYFHLMFCIHWQKKELKAFQYLPLAKCYISKAAAGDAEEYKLLDGILRDHIHKLPEDERRKFIGDIVLHGLDGIQTFAEDGNQRKILLNILVNYLSELEIKKDIQDIIAADHAFLDLCRSKVNREGFLVLTKKLGCEALGKDPKVGQGLEKQASISLPPIPKAALEEASAQPEVPNIDEAERYKRKKEIEEEQRKSEEEDKARWAQLRIKNKKEKKEKSQHPKPLKAEPASPSTISLKQELKAKASELMTFANKSPYYWQDTPKNYFFERKFTVESLEKHYKPRFICTQDAEIKEAEIKVKRPSSLKPLPPEDPPLPKPVENVPLSSLTEYRKDRDQTAASRQKHKLNEEIKLHPSTIYSPEVNRIGAAIISLKNIKTLMKKMESVSPHTNQRNHYLVFRALMYHLMRFAESLYPTDHAKAFSRETKREIAEHIGDLELIHQLRNDVRNWFQCVTYTAVVEVCKTVVGLEEVLESFIQQIDRRAVAPGVPIIAPKGGKLLKVAFAPLVSDKAKNEWCSKDPVKMKEAYLALLKNEFEQLSLFSDPDPGKNNLTNFTMHGHFERPAVKMSCSIIDKCLDALNIGIEQRGQLKKMSNIIGHRIGEEEQAGFYCYEEISPDDLYAFAVNSKKMYKKIKNILNQEKDESLSRQ